MIQRLGLIILVLLSFSIRGFAYPSSERTDSTGTTPVVDVGLQQSECFSLSADDRYGFSGSGDTLQRVDLGTYALTATQFYDVSEDDDLSGSITDCVYSTTGNILYVGQDDGDLLTVDIDTLDSAPTSTDTTLVTISRMAITDDESTLFLYDANATTLYQYTIATGTLKIAWDIADAYSPDSVSITDMVVVHNASGTSDRVYLATNLGEVVMVQENLATIGARIVIDSDGTDTISYVAVDPDNTYVYALNSTAKTLHRILVSASTVTDFTDDLSENGTFKGMVITDVTNPTGTYGFVSGSEGISVFDTSDLNIFDFVSGGNPDEPFSISSSGPIFATGDGYVLVLAGGGELAVISDNPFVSATDTTYSAGSALTTGRSVTVTFEADEAGTYEFRSGDIDQTGTRLTDSLGATTGTLTTANTEQTATFNFADISDVVDEGDNTIFLFVTDADGNVGRKGFTLSVDSPPAAVSIESVTFGNGKLYLTFTRLTASDIDYYNIYADTDAATVATMATATTTINQASSGTTMTATVSGLTNGTNYYLAIEAVDDGGQVGTRSTTSATTQPEATVGPAGLSGETGGCALVSVDQGSHQQWRWLAMGLMLMVTCGIGIFRRGRIIALVVVLLLGYGYVADAGTVTPRHWTFEFKGGLWQPTDSISKQSFGSWYNPIGFVEGGYLLDNKFGFELMSGFLYDSGVARGSISGTPSGDTFSFLSVPMGMNATFRGRFSERQPVIPYAKVGPDFVYFRESTQGTVTQGLKNGLHSAVGIQISMAGIDPDASDSDIELGLNDTSLVLEGRYQWINNFGGNGLDLSGFVYTLGFLFEF